jgi:hypothetical protein
MNGYEDLTNESPTYHGKQWKFFFHKHAGPVLIMEGSNYLQFLRSIYKYYFLQQ